MIRGTVTGDREIVIQLELAGTNRRSTTMPAVVDTGFNGFLTLPMSVLSLLGASLVGTRRAELGDGNLVELDVYVVSARWENIDRDVLALQADSVPLVGMSMLWGSKVTFDAEVGGSIEIDPIP